MKKLIFIGLLLFAFVLIADDVEVKLNGASSSEMFSVQDNASTKLFIVKGHGVVTLPVHPNTAIPTGTAGDMYYNSTDNKVYYHNGTSWTDMTPAVLETDPTLTDDGAVTIGSGGVDPVTLTLTAGGTGDGTIAWDDANSEFEINGGNVAIGTTTAYDNLHLYVNSINDNGMIIQNVNSVGESRILLTDNPTSGNYRELQISKGNGSAAGTITDLALPLANLGTIMIGADNSNSGLLVGVIADSPLYFSTSNVVQTVTTPVGIINDLHQSRARAYQQSVLYLIANPAAMGGQLIPVSAWTAIDYDMISYDAQGEFALGAPGFFAATEDGYYQVNARIDFLLYNIETQEIIGNPNFPGYVSIAIYIDRNDGNGFVMYAQGNKLQGADNNGVPEQWNNLQNNLAPNVSDVVELFANERIQIRAWQSLWNIGLPLRVREQNGATDIPLGSSQIYVSIHKSS
ncbi:MAG: hypothetical protein K8S23_13545 [Candidatus Cloacimonetes bacterium]|nr:hypothetical protein [Candidatus Cloacimonadota bacterium]